MGRELCAREPVFAEAFERCAAAFAAEGVDLLAAPEGLERVELVQPLVFTIQVALAALLASWGVQPDAVIGHSMGEAAAAVVARALDLADAARVVAVRSRLLARIAGRGAMGLVELSGAETEAALAGRPGLAVAAFNGARQTVVAGEPAELADLLAELESRGVFCRLVRVDVASHSPQVEPLLGELVRRAREGHAASGRYTSAFMVTVFAGLEDGWLRPDSPARKRLAQLGVERLILLVAPPFDPGEIRAAGRLLA
jgi:acyl transferase domain-containing protein